MGLFLLWSHVASLLLLHYTTVSIISAVEEVVQQITVCENLDQSLDLLVPFDPLILNDVSFVFFSWRKENSSGGKEEELMMILSESTEVKDPRFQLKGAYGLHLPSVETTDAGVYRAALYTTKNSENKQLRLNVTVASPPLLQSETLKITVDKTADEKTVKCGQVQDLGSPEVEMIFVLSNGTTIFGSFDDGYLTTDNQDVFDDTELTCQISDESMAKACIPVLDRSKWSEKVSFVDTGASSASADKMLPVIIVIIVILIVIILVVGGLVIKKRRNSRNNDESNKNQNKEATETSDYPDPPRIPSKSVSPYMVAGLKLDSNTSHKSSSTPTHYASVPTKDRSDRKPPPASLLVDDTDNDSTVPSYSSQKNQDRKSWASGLSSNDKGSSVEASRGGAPVPMERHKYFTRSDDALNLLDNREDERQTFDIGGATHAGTLV